MTDETAAGPQREGDPAFATEATSEETEGSSQEQEENQEGETQPAEGGNTRTSEEKPFHEHPRWLERETEWNTRFNDQETRHQKDLKDIREEFGTKRADNAAQTQVPAWFGGSREQWNAYRVDRDAELQSAEDRAETRAFEKLKGERTQEAKAVEDATIYMRSELAAIEADKVLNPTGAKVDADKLLKTVLDNELIDSKGRWNYRAGWKLLNAGKPAAPAVDKKAAADKKEVAAATTSEARGETKPKTYMTSSDFKRDRPW